ncbi:MAG TPA: LamG domain-containing protein [Patescibacteria group bacterium]|jgi:hypothetical protein|nr:LamG domain-containing protein [Patescibacteria group bacterium]
MKRRVGLFALSVGVISALFVQVVNADRYTSSNYTIDASEVGNSFGGASSDADYKLTSSGGESVIGQGSGGSYQLDSGYVAELQSSLQLSVQPHALMGYYPLDETQGSVYRDRATSGIDGYPIGAPTSVAGKVGNALSFNGTSQLVSVGGSAGFQSTKHTLEAWIKTTSTSSTMGVVTKGGDFWLGIDFNKVAIYDWNTGTTCSASTVSVGNGAWHHIAATLDSGVTNGSLIYVDGVQVKACTWTQTSQGGSTAIGAAAASPWGQYYNGSIDEVKIFSGTLSPSQIKAEYSAGSAGSTAGLSFATDVVPGISQTSSYDAIVLTDAPNGYTLALSQNQNLTKGSDTISPVAGTIASPLSWSEGTTKGFGFTLYGTNATAIDGKWSSGTAYAAFPGSATSFYTRSGTQSAKDVINMRLRLDVPSTQPSGTYTNVITTTGTITP